MSPIKTIRSLAVLLVAFVSQIALAQTEAAATIPASFVGTYSLTYSQSAAGAPFSDGESVTLVVGSDNSLCVDGKTLTSPVLRNGNAHEAIWKDTAASVEYALSSLLNGFNEVNLGGLGGSSFFGQLRGSKTSSSTSCTGSSTPTVTSSMSQIFELAESKLGTYFPAGAVTAFLDNYVYRFYEATGVYLAFADGNVFLLGGGFGNAVVSAGSISSVLTALDVYEVTDGVTGDLEKWNLNISGTVTTFGTSIGFAGIQLTNIPAPEMSDTDEINEEIQTTLAGVATGITSVSITVINDSSSQRTFDVAFSATANGVSLTYNLRYDYTK